jgi:hypothetical protein
MHPKASSAVRHMYIAPNVPEKNAVHKHDESMHINIKGPIFGTVIT